MSCSTPLGMWTSGPRPEFGVEYHCRTIEDPYVVMIGAVAMPTEVAARLDGQHARHRGIGAPQHPVGETPPRGPIGSIGRAAIASGVNTTG